MDYDDYEGPSLAELLKEEYEEMSEKEQQRADRYRQVPYTYGDELL